MSSPKVAFILLTWNSKDYCEACLRSILSLREIDPMIYVADNGSEDDTPERLRNMASAFPSKIDITFYPKNKGTTKPRNFLLAKARKEAPDYICILDSDTLITDMAMMELIRALREDEQLSLVTPRMWNRSEEEQMSAKRFPTLRGKCLKASRNPEKRRQGVEAEKYDFFPAPTTDGHPPVTPESDKAVYEVDYAISACWLFTPEVPEKFGMLDEHFFYAPEDVDYCANIARKGGKVALVSHSSIYHLTQRVSHKKRISIMNVHHICGLIRYFMKYRYINHPKIR